MDRYQCTYCDYFEVGGFENYYTCRLECRRENVPFIVCANCMKERLITCARCKKKRCMFCVKVNHKTCLQCEETWSPEELAALRESNNEGEMKDVTSPTKANTEKTKHTPIKSKREYKAKSAPKKTSQGRDKMKKSH